MLHRIDSSLKIYVSERILCKSYRILKVKGIDEERKPLNDPLII